MKHYVANNMPNKEDPTYVHHDKLFFITIERINKPNCKDPRSGLGSASESESVGESVVKV